MKVVSVLGQKRMPDHPGESYRSTKTRNCDQATPLCSECEKIDFKDILDIDISGLQKNGFCITVADLGTRIDSIEASRCALCQLFYSSSKGWCSVGGKLYLCAYSYMETTSSI
jgi:hypothetical protein